jgi:hypothetical protein
MKRNLQNILNIAIKNRQGLMLLLLLTTVTVTYLPALFNNFILRWDDQWVVINHYSYGGFTADNLWKVLTEFYHGQYSPVNQLYYILLYSINGFDPKDGKKRTKKVKKIKTLCLRLVYCRDEQGRKYRFITNNWEISDEEVALVCINVAGQ